MGRLVANLPDIATLPGVACLTAAVVVFVFTVLGEGAPERTRPSPDPAREHVRALLWDARQAWNDRSRSRARRALAGAMRNQGQRAALVRLLDDLDPDLRVEAIHVVGSAQCREAMPRLQALLESGSASPRERAATIDALDQLQPFDPEQLEQFLASADEGCLLGALQIASRRGGLPATLLAEHLGHRDPEVRKLVIDAFPSVLDGPACTAVLRSLEDDASYAAAAQVLERIRVTPRVESILTSWLGKVPYLRGVLLGALARKRMPLRDPAPVAAIALGREAGDAVEQILGLLCLEQTRSEVDLTAVERNLMFQTPPVRYFAIRLLLQRRRPGSSAALLGLLDEFDWRDNGIDEELARVIRDDFLRQAAGFVGTDAQSLSQSPDITQREVWAQRAPASLTPSGVAFGTVCPPAMTGSAATPGR